MAEILTVGEIIVEIMREKPGIGLNEVGIFNGPFASGAPAIFIDAVANLGHSAAIIGGIGDDGFGQVCMNRFNRDGVNALGVKISNLPTGVAFVSYSHDGSRKYIFHINGTASSEFGTLPHDKVAQTKIFHIMGCSLMISENIAYEIIKYAEIVKLSGGKISFDPNIRVELMNKNYIRTALDRVLQISDIILPSLNELLFLVNIDKKEDAVQSLLSTAETIVLKMGSKGCEIFSRKTKEPILVPSIGINEVDPTGAGDAFDAGFLCGVLENKSLFDCGLLANACGAMNASKLGPMEGIFKRDIIEKFISVNT